MLLSIIVYCQIGTVYPTSIELNTQTLLMRANDHRNTFSGYATLETNPFHSLYSLKLSRDNIQLKILNGTNDIEVCTSNGCSQCK